MSDCVPSRTRSRSRKLRSRLIGEHLQASRVHYAQIDDSEFLVRQSYVRGVAPLADRGHVQRFGQTVVQACRRGETVVVSDTNPDERFTDAERAHLLQSEIAAFMGVPLIKGGRWVALFGIHSEAPRTWTRDQMHWSR